MSKRTLPPVLLVGLILLIAASGSGRAAPIPSSSHHRLFPALSDDLCSPLPDPTGPTVTVSTVYELQQAVLNAASGDTILLADGTYALDGVYLRFDTPNVTLRSASGDREAVILDGNYVTTEIVQIVVSNITIAELTLREAYHHPIHVTSSDRGDTTNTLIYDVHIVDPGEQAIKINPGAEGTYPDDGVVACSHIELTNAGRPHIRNNCYTGGVDAHQARGWTVRDNTIEGFWCATGLSEHGIHFWRACRDTLVERNVLRDNARGIGFGLDSTGDARTYPDDPCPGAGGEYVDHYDGVIRNNFIFADQSELFASEYGFDCGICLWQACGTQTVHNTVASTQAPFSSIEWRFDNTDVEITNNLVTHNLRDRGGVASLAGNLEYAPLSLFVDGPGGDLHLTASASSAIDQGESLTEGLCDADIDGDARPIGSAPDVGADEYGIAPPAAVTNLRVTQAVTRTDTLTATLRWTAPSEAVTSTLRFSGSPISEANWSFATPLTDTLPGGAESYTATVSCEGGTIYFAHRSQNGGGWSALSNNAFWPRRDVYLPLVLKESVP